MSIFLAAAGHPAGPLRSTGAKIKTEPADPNLRPWEVLIKTDVNFSGTAAAHPPSRLLWHWNRDKDRAGGELQQIKTFGLASPWTLATYLKHP